VRYTDFLRATVLLAAGEGTALLVVTIAVAASRDDTTLLIFTLAWWGVAAALGAWLGRRQSTTASIARLLAQARSTTMLPQIRPGAVLLNRLWPLLLLAVVAAATAWLVPQFTAVAAGGATLVALAWRKQAAAVLAIEERDGVRYFVVPSSPLRAIELERTAALRRVTGNGAVPP
jgi:hypothetical protein